MENKFQLDHLTMSTPACPRIDEKKICSSFLKIVFDDSRTKDNFCTPVMFDVFDQTVDAIRHGKRHVFG